MFRIGYSEDIHKVDPSRKLYLGGLYIPNEDGLFGYSDADVVLHSVAESILGALALGDLGDHFPDNDPRYKDISSVLLLNEVVALMREEGYHVYNIDIQICASRPKLAELKEEIRKNIAVMLDVDVKAVSVKACSYNEIGEIGEHKAIKSVSVVLLEENK